MIIDNRYKVIERLGMGAWAVVYKVKDLRTDGDYVLKIFQNIDTKTLYKNISAANMFLITKLQHPNLMNVTSFGSVDKTIYYLSEYYEGKTLSHFNFSTDTIDDLYDIIVQTCYGLNELHSRGLLHKDIKPDNILYNLKDDKMQVRLLDYGFSKADVRRNQQYISGTLPYIAPEVFRGGKTYPESDFYSLGVTLYRVVTGTLPYTIEQLSDMITGGRSNLFPKFPRELNPAIPPSLEKFILKLMERNKEDRFPDAVSIIRYINRIQTKQYSFSHKFSLLNSIQYNSSLTREEYAKDLSNYLPLIEQKNGKIIVLSGEEGLGKNNILTLFRYHLLTDDYYLFDYTCSPSAKDPFFALMREFISSIASNKEISDGLVLISEKMKRFLYSSEESDEPELDNKKLIKRDYNFGKSFLQALSEDKPLVFIIRAGHYLTKETIEFVNFVSSTVRLNRIMIIFSVDNVGSVKGLVHPINIEVQPLTIEETKVYIEDLLQAEAPDDFVYTIRERTNGNPAHIKEILIDLVDKKLPWNENKFNFQIDLSDYKLPESIIHNIYNNLGHLQDKSYQALQTLSVVAPPLSHSLMKHILKITDKELFFLVQDCMNNHIIVKDEEYYFFSYKEAKDRLLSEMEEGKKIEVSKSVLTYYKPETVTHLDICKGIIENAKIAEDIESIRTYTLKLYELYNQYGEQDKAFESITKVIEFDFSLDLDVPEQEKLNDLRRFQEAAELTGRIKSALNLFDSLPNLPEIFENHYIKGVLHSTSENYKAAKDEFHKALDLAISGRQRVTAMIQLLWVSLMLNELDKAEGYIKQLETLEMPLDLEVAFTDRKGIYLFKKGRVREAIQLMNDFKPNIKDLSEPGYYVKLGNFYNNLALFNSSERFFDEALLHFQKAEKIWKQINYKRALGIIYNNYGDLVLRQGNTQDALKYFDNALKICLETDQTKCESLTYLNFGEAYIKLGRYKEAEKSLQAAYNKVIKQKEKSILPSIIHNIAIVKSKIRDFHNYYQFIKEQTPEILTENITTINPLIKTYFYFLLDVGSIDRIEELTIKNTNLDYITAQEEEFFFHIQGLIDMHKGDYSDALEHLDIAFKHAEKNRSHYAQCILYTKMIECHLNLGSTAKASELYLKAKKLTAQYEYNYWNTVLEILKSQIDLQDKHINLRYILRSLFASLEVTRQNDYFQLELRALHSIVIVFRELRARRKAREYYNYYTMAINRVSKDLPESLKKSLAVKMQADKESVDELLYLPIAKRELPTNEQWQRELYELLNLDEVDRFKYFINRILKRMFVPHFYSLVLIEDYNRGQRPFLIFNMKLKQLYVKDVEKNIRESVRSNDIIRDKIGESNVMYIPLRLKGAVVGCLIIGDAGELSFTETELKLAENLRINLTSLLIRIRDITAINKNTKLMRQLMTASNEFFSLKDIDKLESEIVSFTIDFIQCNRAFLIKKDTYGNFVYQIAMDNHKNLISDHTRISKSVLSEVYNTKRLAYTLNASADNILKNSISVQDYQLRSIFCAPIIIDNEIYGLLYADNNINPNRELHIDLNIMELFLMQSGVALKNAKQYRSLMKKNMELVSLDKAKNKFMEVVSHELNTPLMVLQNLFSRLKKEEVISQEEREATINKADGSLKRIIDKINDIYSLTKYSMMTSIKKEKIDVKDLLETIISEASIVSRDRKMIFRLEVEDNIPEVEANWQAFYLMIYHITLNAIRYTKDFGTIVIGARKSSFQDEEIDNRETLVVFIQDNGMGIPDHELGEIFTPFHELVDSYSHHSGTIEYKSSGLGVGLSIAKQIAELHNGDIKVTSKEKEGTTVFIFVPFSEVEGYSINEPIKTE